MFKGCGKIWKNMEKYGICTECFVIGTVRNVL